MSPEFSTLVELARYRAHHEPDQLACTFLVDGESEGVRLTYRQLDRQARAIAARLQRLDAPGERALLLLPTSPEYVTALFGCLYAGIVPVPAFAPRLNRPTPRLQAIAVDARAALALTTPDILARAERYLRHSPDLKDLRWESTSYPEPDGEVETWREPALAADSLAFIQYTSGSTAAPKGVMISHGNVLHNVARIERAFGFRRIHEANPGSAGVCWMPLYHDAGLVLGLLLAVYTGAPLVLISPVAFAQRPARWLEAITRYGGAVSGAPNFAFQLCVDRITPREREGLDLSRWMVALSGGEPVRADTLERFADAFAPCGFRPEAFTPAYGLAEASVIVSTKVGPSPPIVYTVQRSSLEQGKVVEVAAVDESSQTLVSCGQVLPGHHVAIVDPQSLIRCPEGHVGEIWVAGPSVAQGYWNRPEETEQTFDAYLADSGEGPFLRTGDLGLLRGGELVVTGRLKDLVIIHGRNYYAEDIELTASRSHPALQPDGGAAFSITRDGEEQLVIVHELSRRRRDADVGEVARAIRRAVAEDQELAVYAVVLAKPGGVPRTTSGKIQRHACKASFLADRLEAIGTILLDHRDPAGDRDPSGGSFAGPRTPIEETLAGTWAEVLSLDRVGVHDNFFELGGHSLVAAQVVSRAREIFHVELPLRSLFEEPTVAGLAEQIRTALRDGPALDVPPLQPVDRTGPLPCSFSQERIWFLHQLAPGSSAYALSQAVHLVGPIDMVALQQSVNEVVRRHEALRTTFAAVEGQPVQVIAPPFAMHVPAVDVRGVPEPDRKSQAAQLAEATARQPFDLTRGPLFRMTLLRLGDEEHILVFNMHHTIADAWSLGLLMEELASLYNAHASGESVRLPAPEIQYADFALWQREWLAGEELERQMAYWRGRLEQLPVLELPADHARPAMQTYHGATERFDIPGELLAQLKRLSHQEGVTPFMTLLAAFNVLLHRYTGQTDIAVGVPTANRNWLAAEHLVGTLVNTLVIRTDLSGDPTFRDLLQREREVALDALAHQDLPFAKLVAELQPERDTSRAPLSQVMFNHVKVPVRLPELKDLAITPLQIDRRAAQFDLTVSVTDLPTEKSIVIEYNTDLFEAATIARMMGHFVTVLKGVVADPDRRVSLLPMLTGAERNQLLVEWNDTWMEYPWDACIHELFEAQAQQSPDAVAVVFGDRSLTYAELNARANRTAHYLRGRGVGPGVLVGIHVERSVEMMVGLLGILKAGGAYVPLDPAYPQERLAFMVADSRVSVLLTQESLAGALPADGIEVVCLDRDWGEIASESEENPASGVMCTALAYVIYTSGSTGRPKGVQIPHRAVVNFLTSMRQRPGLTSQDVLLAVTTLSFDIAVLELFLPLSVGARVVIASRETARDGRQLAQTLAGCGATVMQATPATWRLMLAAGWRGNKQLKVLCGGEALPRDLAEDLAARCGSLWNMYGPTETTVWSSIEQIEDGDAAISIGRPIANTQMYVLDSHLQPVPVGVPGKLYIGGDGLAQGYLNRPPLTAEKFIANPFGDDASPPIYDTGDLARYLPDGRLECLGRVDSQVKIRGFRVELGEIEAVLGQHVAVRDNAVVVRENADGDKRLIAYVVTDEALPVTTSDLRSFLEEMLPGYMVPSAFVVLEALPLTPNGKVDRGALSERHLQWERAYVAPRYELERRLVEVWEDVLGTRPVGVQDSFFDLGGHSLLAVRLLSEIGATLGSELSLASLLQSPTVERMAQLIRDHVGPPDPATLVPIQPGGTRPPLFCVHGLGGEVLGYARLAHLLGPDQPVYGLRANGLSDDSEPHARIEEMAAHYVKIMRELQPAGPYYLCGYSYGGIVAFEIARQLRVQGERVALLALVACYALRRSEAIGQLWRPRNVVKFLRNLRPWARDYWRLGSTRALVGEIPERYRRVAEAHRQALDAYRPGRYPGRVTLFRVQALSLFRSYDPALGWGKLAVGGVDTTVIPGAHYDILEEPHVKVLAAQLHSSLEQAQAAAQPPRPWHSREDR